MGKQLKNHFFKDYVNMTNKDMTKMLNFISQQGNANQKNKEMST